MGNESNEERNRKSVTIGLNMGGTYESIDGVGLDDIPNESTLISKEYRNAREALKSTGQLPISIDNKCLMSMADGRDTSIVLKLFKTACLSYQPTDLKYRDHTMSRAQML